MSVAYLLFAGVVMISLLCCRCHRFRCSSYDNFCLAVWMFSSNLVIVDCEPHIMSCVRFWFGVSLFLRLVINS